MGFWKDRADEFTGRDKVPAKAESRGSVRGTLPGGNARGTYFDKNGKLQIAPIEELYTKDGRWRGPKGQR